MNKRNAIIALLLAALAALMLLGAHAGYVGHLLAIGTYGAFGVVGTRLLAGTLFTLAFILATPPGTLGRVTGRVYYVAVWLFAHFVGGLVFIIVQAFVALTILGRKACGS